MKELRNILSLVNNIANDADAKRIFGEIAHELMSNYQVRKNNKQYRFLEIEFYWHSPNHPDESVYPRQKSEGYWFLHPSGVDITLPSTTTDSYGGILIRTMQNVAHPEEVYSGPWNCSDALFDYLPMDGRVNDMIPQIVRISKDNAEPFQIEQSLRQGITQKHTAEYYTKGYCYYVRVPEWEKMKAANKPWNKRRTEYMNFKNK